jgi:hypothetical protein
VRLVVAKECFCFPCQLSFDQQLDINYHPTLHRLDTDSVEKELPQNTPTWSFEFPDQNCMGHASYIPRPSHPWFDYPNNIRRGYKLCSFSWYNFIQPPVTSSPLSPFFWAPCFQTPSLHVLSIFFSVAYFTTLSVSRLNSVGWWDDWRMMGQKAVVASSWYYPSICLEKLGKPARKHNNRCSSRDSNPASAEYKPRA